MAENVVYVGRPTMWGNPFAYRQWGHAKATILHQRWLAGDLGALTLERMSFSPAEIDALGRLRERVLLNLHTLASRDLACWCPINSAWCHAQTLIDLAKVHSDYHRHAA